MKLRIKITLHIMDDGKMSLEEIKEAKKADKDTSKAEKKKWQRYNEKNKKKYQRDAEKNVLTNADGK